MARSNNRAVADAGLGLSKKAGSFLALLNVSDKKYTAAHCNICLRRASWTADTYFLLGARQRAKPVTCTRVLSVASGHGTNRQSAVR